MTQCNLLIITLVSPHLDNPLAFSAWLWLNSSQGDSASYLKGTWCGTQLLF